MDELTQEILACDKTSITLAKYKGTWKYVLSQTEQLQFLKVFEILEERAKDGIWNPLAFATFIRKDNKLILRDFGL